LKKEEFKFKLNELSKDKKVVYIDESGFVENMDRTHGYSLKGVPCGGLKLQNQHIRTNVIGALQENKLVHCMAINSSINSIVFKSWFTHLAQNLPQPSVLVLDNASFHKAKDIEKIAQSFGHDLLYLPPYSPDLNPIEKMWANLKKLKTKFICSTSDLFSKFSNHFFHHNYF